MTKTLLLAATALMLMAIPVNAEDAMHAAPAAVEHAVEHAAPAVAEPEPVTQPAPVMEQCFDEHGMEVDCPKAETAVEVAPEAEAEAMEDAAHSETPHAEEGHAEEGHAAPAAH